MTGEELKQIREGLKLSQREFARILGVSNMMFVRGERGTPSRMLVLTLQQWQASRPGRNMMRKFAVK